MNTLCGLKYALSNAVKKVKVKKTVIKAVKIDFPLPDKVIGIEKRMNTGGSFALPEYIYQKVKPEHLIGTNVRLLHLVNNWEKYVDQVVTVVGWAREARLQAKDTLLFIKLVDGSNTIPLQVVIENTIPNWEDVKKAKLGYSFKLRGKIIKSLGKGQTIELKLKGD